MSSGIVYKSLSAVQSLIMNIYQHALILLQSLVASSQWRFKGWAGGPCAPPVSLSLFNLHNCVTHSTVLIDVLYTWHCELNLRPSPPLHLL